MAQVGDSLSGNWWISYADSEGMAANVDGLRVLCFALYLVSIKSPCAFRSPESKRKLEAFGQAIRTLGVTELDESKAERLTFRQIVFFVDDLWIFPKLETLFWKGKGLSQPIAANGLGDAGADLETLFWRWFRRWESGAIAPFPGGVGCKVKRSERFQEFTKRVADLCHHPVPPAQPTRGRKPDVPRQDGLPDAVRLIADVLDANPGHKERDVIRAALGLNGTVGVFRVVNRLPDDRFEWSDCIQSGELGERDKGDLVANDKAVRLVQRHLAKFRAGRR